MPYTERDAEFFYGRERDSRLILDNLGAYPLTVLYGPSGVGKSSVLRAGVLRLLHEESEQRRLRFGVVEDAIVYFSQWRDDPGRMLPAALSSALEVATGTAPGFPVDRLDGESIVSACNELRIHLLIVLDQFEEYFLYHEHEGDRFGRQLASLLGPVSRVSLLIAIREDNLAKLDRFEAALPSIFSRTLRLKHLDRDSAREAVLKPLDRYNSLVPEQDRRTIEPPLVEQLLDQVQTGRVRVAGQAASASAAAAASAPRYSDRIEAPFLQLVLTRLWEEESTSGSPVLRPETLERLGGAQSIVRDHLDRVVAGFEPGEHGVLADVFAQLVTPGGTKIAHTASDLAALAHTDRDHVVRLLNQLCLGDKRILREVPPPGDDPHSEPRFEIFHDVLALAVLDWRRRWVAARDQEEAHRSLQLEKQHAELQARETRRRLRRARILVGSLALLLVACLVLAGVTVARTKQADRALAESRQNALLALVQRDLELDPTRALQTSLDAWDLGHTPQAEAALRRSYDAAATDLVLDLGDMPVVTATFTRDGSKLVTSSEDGHVRVFDSGSGRELADNDIGGVAGSRRRLISAQLVGDDSLAVVGTSRGAAVIVPLDGSKPTLLDTTLLATSEMTGNVGVSVSTQPRNPVALTFGYDGKGAQLWDTRTGNLLRELAVAGRVAAATLDDTGQFAATWTDDGKLRVWDTARGKAIAGVAFRDRIEDLRFSPTSPGLLAGTDATAVRAFTWRWRQSQPKWLGDQVFDYFINSIQFDPSGRRIILTGDKYVVVLDLRGELLSTNLTAHDFVNKASISPDGRLIASATNDGEVLVAYSNRANYRPLRSLSGHGAALNDVSFSATGNKIATAGADGTVRIWRLPKLTRSWGDQWGAWSLWARFTSSGEVAVALASGEVRLVNARTGAVVWHGQAVDWNTLQSLDVSPDGLSVVVGGTWMATPKVLHLDGGASPKFRPPHKPFYLTRARWSPSPALPLIVAGDRNNRVVAWEAEDGGPPVWKRKLGSAYEEVVDLEFSRHARTLVVVSSDGRLRVLDPQDGRELSTVTVGLVSDVAVSSDGRFAATAGEDQSVRIWDLQKPDGAPPLHEFAEPTGTIAEVAFSRDAHSQWVAAVGADGFTYVWDRQTGFLRAALRRHGDYVNAVDFDPRDRTRLVTASDDGSAAIYSCSPCDLDADELAAAARKQLPDRRSTSVKPETRETQASPD
jgi:WD40 repeat protein